jgi:hypothetical protein
VYYWFQVISISNLTMRGEGWILNESRLFGWLKLTVIHYAFLSLYCSSALPVVGVLSVFSNCCWSTLSLFLCLIPSLKKVQFTTLTYLLVHL